MRGRAPRLPWLLLLALAACQAPVRPEPEDPPEPATPVAVAPVAATPPVAPLPPPPVETPPAPNPIDTGAELFDHLSARFSSPVCVDGDRNRAWRRRYAGHPASFARHVEQVMPLMAYVAVELDRRGLPAEFALVPVVESWYRPEAIGPGGPAGLWQMIASTARGHGVRIQPGYDGRLSPVASTDAALDYLTALSARFDGEWRATAMAYNAGEYRLLRAFRASGDRVVSGERQLPRGLSHTTYEYVAKLHALACLLAHPGRHGLVLPREARFTPLMRATLPAGATSLEQAALALATDAATLRRLNPAYRQGRIPPGVPREVLVPASAATQLAAGAIAAAPAVPSEPRIHRVRRGDTLSRIARDYGVALRRLYELNGLDARSVLQLGQAIVVEP